MASLEERRRQAAETRKRQIRRERAALGGVVTAILLGLAWIGLGGLSSPKDARALPAKSATPAAAMAVFGRYAAVNRVLGYTDYIRRGTARGREIALTFDDGPGPYTQSVVKVLRRLHVPATFFTVGQEFSDFRGPLHLLRRRGYAVGDHTLHHPMLGRLPRPAQAAEIDAQARLLQRAGFPYPRLLRPPNGSFNRDTRSLLRRRHMLMVLWSVDSEDYLRLGVAQIQKRVLAGARPGAIILLHDGGGDRSQTVAALPKIIRKLRRRGFHLVDVPQMLRDAPPRRGQGPPPNVSGQS